MYRCILQWSKVSKKLVNVRFRDAIIQIGDEQFGWSASDTAANRSTGSQHFLAAFEHIVLPCAVDIALELEEFAKSHTHGHGPHTKLCACLSRIASACTSNPHRQETIFFFSFRECNLRHMASGGNWWRDLSVETHVCMVDIGLFVLTGDWPWCSKVRLSQPQRHNTQREPYTQTKVYRCCCSLLEINDGILWIDGVAWCENRSQKAQNELERTIRIFILVLLTLILRDCPYVCIFEVCHYLGSLWSHLHTPFAGIC